MVEGIEERTRNYRSDGLAHLLYEISLSERFKSVIKGKLTRECFLEILDSMEVKGKIDFEDITRIGFEYAKKFVTAVEESPALRGSPALEELKGSYNADEMKEIFWEAAERKGIRYFDAVHIHNCLREGFIKLQFNPQGEC